MKAYLRAKSDAAKDTIFNFPALVKTWQGKTWKGAKHKLNTTDWPQTIVGFIGWAVRQSIQGVLFGMGAFSILTQVVVWDAITKRNLGDGPVPMGDIYGVLESGFGVNVLFAGAGILACMVINLHKLSLHRLDGYGPQFFVIEPTDDESVAMVRAIVERQGRPKIS